jgi:formate hydrogenlyase transcriptional activator
MQKVPEPQSSAVAASIHDAARRYRALLQIADAAANCTIPELLRKTADWILSLFPCHLLAHSVYLPSHNQMLVHRLKLHEHTLLEPMQAPVENSPSGWVWANQKPLILTELGGERRFPHAIQILQSWGVRSLVVLPLTTPRRCLGALDFGSREPNRYDESILEFLTVVTGLMALALETSTHKETLNHTPPAAPFLDPASCSEKEDLSCRQMVGESSAFKDVLQRIKTVAASNTAVLITGETGTGKELVARAIHGESLRRSSRFVALNCAAIPAGLLESELFGHEKGAFTGASSQKMGRFELADGGTLFLDEIGDVPLELQPKLLRALQGQEFERLGGTKTIRVNARVIAATNQNLETAIREGRFRSDLFYRLNVFPIHVPPLRERFDDLRGLVAYFVDSFSREMGKKIEPVSENVIAELKHWHWPGNIRELANFIERSVLLTEGSILRPPLGDLHPHKTRAAGADTLEEVEREYIVRTLRSVHGVISGSQGAAAKLGMKRTTLQSKIQRLGIERGEFEP